MSSPAPDAQNDASPEPFVRPLRKRKAVDYADDGEDDEQAPKLKRARGRKSRQIAEDSDDDKHDSDDKYDSGNEAPAPPPKKKAPVVKRAPRKSKPKNATRAVSDDDGDGDTSSDSGSGSDGRVGSSTSKRKVKRPTKPKTKAKSKKAKADTAASAASEHEDDEEELADKPKRKRKPRTPKPAAADGDEAPKRRGRKKAAFPAPAIATDADGRESVDPTMATMADICADPGVGRLSTRYAAVQESFATEKQRRKERRSEMHARAMKRLYGEPVDGEPTSTAHVKLSLRENDGDDDGAGKGDDFDYDQAVNVSGHHAAQVRIGPNGEVIIDEESLQVDRSAAPEHHVDEDAMVHIEENDLTRFVNQATYSRKVAGARWSKEETELFYHALQQFGSDFTSIALMLGTRPRNQIKQKFNREDKLNPERITWALKNRIPIDIETLSKKTGKSFDGPVPQYGPTEEQLAEAAARATPAASSRKHTPASNRDPSEAPSAASAGKKGGRKRGNALPEGLEVLGSIDDYVDKDDD